ncbi:MAG TPA: phosphoribosylformylglycinamidine cyclo-ligase [Steroidobacteraceae bacterium]|nr:phosphoribosylformylglycinamidine cyclo-ligase [Steroidobacteraceae bacterium]
MTERAPVTYREAGVDIDAADELIERIKPRVARSMRREVLGGIGGFGALVEVPLERFRRPVLVSGTDGVGTKLRLAIDCKRHDTVGIDLVAMCANDVLVQGAEPLFFLDYFAVGKLEPEIGERIIGGIVEGCLQAGCALVGGETAEMPGMYHGEDYDLAGFCVGIVEKERILDGSATRAGDIVLGLPSSGPHSNGFSLIRKILALSGARLDEPLAGSPLIDQLMTPTRIYVKPVLALLEELPVHGLAHITGGGLVDNIPRVLPEGLEVVLERRSWPHLPVFDWLQRAGQVSDGEMYRVFNCGIGMTVQIAPAHADRAIELLGAAGQPVLRIGEVRRGDRGVAIA